MVIDTFVMVRPGGIVMKRARIWCTDTSSCGQTAEVQENYSALQYTQSTSMQTYKPWVRLAAEIDFVMVRHGAL